MKEIPVLNGMHYGAQWADKSEDEFIAYFTKHFKENNLFTRATDQQKTDMLKNHYKAVVEAVKGTQAVDGKGKK